MTSRRGRSDPRVRHVTGVLLFAAGGVLAAWLALCHAYGVWGMTSDATVAGAAGRTGTVVGATLLEYLGLLSWAAPLLLWFWSVTLWRRASVARAVLRTAFVLFLLPVLAGLGHYLQVPGLADGASQGGGSVPVSRVGMLVGSYVATQLSVYVGRPVAPFLLLAALTVLLLMAIPNMFEYLGRAFGWVPRLRVPSPWGALGAVLRAPFRRRRREKKPDGTAPDSAVPLLEAPLGAGAEGVTRRDHGLRRERAEEAGEEGPRIVTREAKGSRRASEPEGTPPAETDYVHPPFALLDPPKSDGEGLSREELLARSETLVGKLRDFEVETRVTEVHPGPVITLYELEPSPGVKVGQVVNLGNDLALAMKAASVRIVAPIPGKGTIGVEIPNDHPSVVYLSEVVRSQEFAREDSLLKMALGKDISGQPVVTNLEWMPHLLIAGSTGSGKSVCLNSIIACFLFTASPQELSFILIDPKMLELTPYNGIPHLKCPVICDAKVAVRALKWAVGEMENRYQLLARAGARDIESYNQKVRETGSGGEEEPRALPYVVIIVDELADLMLSMPNEIETNIARLAQMARAVGIHMVLATQRPSVDVITGVIKANFPCRMAFRVPSKTDSRTILDQNGAETLLGRGDMLFLASGKRDVMRVHAAYISLEEVERLVEHVKRQPMRPAEPFVDFSRTEAAGGGPRGRDELFDEAAHLVVKHQQGSVSLLQRRLTIGYARAARLIDMLEEAGVVGPFEGSKAREVLIRSEEDLDFIRDSSR